MIYELVSAHERHGVGFPEMNIVLRSEKYLPISNRQRRLTSVFKNDEIAVAIYVSGA
jgi:hypothetical protein